MIKTTNFNLPIIQSKRTKGTLILISTTLILFVLFVISVVFDENSQPPHYLTMIIGILMTCSVLVYILRSYYVEEFTRIGNIIISAGTIEITYNKTTKIYSSAEIKQLIIKLNETSEDSIISSTLIALMNKKGIDNEIEIIDFENNSLKYQVFIKNESWIKLINRILIEWPSEKIVKMKQNKLLSILSD